jgi:hypothetical protein
MVVGVRVLSAVHRAWMIWSGVLASTWIHAFCSVASPASGASNSAHAAAASLPLEREIAIDSMVTSQRAAAGRYR